GDCFAPIASGARGPPGIGEPRRHDATRVITPGKRPGRGALDHPPRPVEGMGIDSGCPGRGRHDPQALPTRTGEAWAAAQKLIALALRYPSRRDGAVGAFPGAVGSVSMTWVFVGGVAGGAGAAGTAGGEVGAAGGGGAGAEGIRAAALGRSSRPIVM